MLSLTESEVALRSGSVAAAMVRDVVIVEGPEAATYLHGQVSQNIEGMANGTASWTLLLEPTGRVTAWARVSRLSDETFWIDVDAGVGEPMLARLARFKLRTKATFELRSDVATTAIRGPEAPLVDNLRAKLAGGSVVGGMAVGEIVVADLGWSKSTGADVLGLDAESAHTLFGLELGDPSVVELERIEAGRPAMGREFAEKTIPAETGVVDRSADFSKGCYVGQELVARVDSRGNNTPRTVYPASMSSALVPIAGAELQFEGQAVGSVTSAAARADGVVALVSVKRSVEIPAVLQVELDGALVDISVTEVDWV